MDFKNTRILKLNNNALTQITEIAGLPNLLELQAKNNQITDIDFMAAQDGVLKHLQKVDLSVNKLKTVPSLSCPSLYQLNVDENEITDADVFGHKALKFLSLNKNKLTTCRGLGSMPAVESISIQ